MTLQVFVYLFTFHQSPQQPYIPVVASYLYCSVFYCSFYTELVSNGGDMFALTYTLTYEHSQYLLKL